MKIALIIFPLHPSHGCILQTYALYSSLKKIGHDVTIVYRQWAAPSLLGYLKRIGKNMYLRLFHGYKGAIFYEGAYPKSNMVELNAFIEKYFCIFFNTFMRGNFSFYIYRYCPQRDQSMFEKVFSKYMQ